MTRYLISFDDGAMKIPEEELPDVAEAAHNVVQEAKNADVWVFGGGVVSQRASVVATDGTATDGPYPETKAVIGEGGKETFPPSDPPISGAPDGQHRDVFLAAHPPHRNPLPRSACPPIVEEEGRTPHCPRRQTRETCHNVPSSRDRAPRVRLRRSGAVWVAR